MFSLSQRQRVEPTYIYSGMRTSSRKSASQIVNHCVPLNHARWDTFVASIFMRLCSVPMKSCHKWKVIFPLSLMLMAVAIPAHADSVWNVTGTLSMTGNSGCSGPCMETLNFHFDFQWLPLFPTSAVYRAAVVPGTMSVDSSGPLGKFTGGDFNPSVSYITFSNSANDQLEFNVRHNTFGDRQTDPDAPPIFFSPDLYSCGTVTCVTDFVPPDSPWFGKTPPLLGLFLPATLDYSLTRVPEPSTGLLLLCGLLLLVIVRKDSTQ